MNEAEEPSFKNRLKWCAEKGRLTICDLALWLDCPHSSVRSWMMTKRCPNSRLRPVLDHRLSKLEFVIVNLDAKKPLTSYKVGSINRKAYIKELMNATGLNSEVSYKNTSK